MIRKLDMMYSHYIRERDKRCVTCGRTTDLTNGHLFSRVNHSTRWDGRNCHAQCKGCNFRHEFDPYPFNSFFIRKFGQEAWDELYREHRTVRKFSNSELAEMISRYEELTGNK